MVDLLNGSPAKTAIKMNMSRHVGPTLLKEQLSVGEEEGEAGLIFEWYMPALHGLSQFCKRLVVVSSTLGEGACADAVTSMHAWSGMTHVVFVFCW